MVTGSYLSIITLNVNRLNAPIKRQRLLSTRDSPQNKGHIQTESEGLEKDTPHK